jgi:septal ring factor EnvC (AmiA/AmiB activator)
LIGRLDTIDSDQTAIRIDMSVVSKTNTNFAAQLDTLETQHTRGEIRLAKLEADIVDVTAEIEALTIQITDIETKSM